MLLGSAVLAPDIAYSDEPLQAHAPFSDDSTAAFSIANDNVFTIELELQRRFAGAQRELANVAMYLAPDFRARITKQLRVLLSAENWEEGDEHLNLASARSFARAMAVLRPNQRPLLGLSNAGNLLAMWKEEGAQAVFEHLPGDIVKWSISSGTGASEDRASGRAPIERVAGILRGHSLESLLNG